MTPCLRSLLFFALCAAGLNLHAVTPVVTTTAATGVTDRSAVFNGTIEPNGETFEVRAEYGLTTDYGYRSLSSYLFGSGVKPCQFTPFGLSSNTTYHFRIVATTVDGTSIYVGNDMTLTTLANPPSVGAAGASAASNNPSDVWFYAQNVAAGSSEATLSYEYGLTTAYGSTVSDPSPREKDSFVGFTSNIHALGFQPATTYHFRAKIVNQQGTAYSPDNAFTTPSGPVLVTTPATGITDLAAVLHGTANTDGLQLHLSFEYGPTTDYGQAIDVPGYITNTSPASVLAEPNGLLPSTVYHYRLKAVWSSDNSFAYFGPDQTFTTGPPNTPPTVGTIGSYNETSDSAVVNCSPVSSGSSAATVVFEYGLTTAYGTSVTVDPVMAPSLNQQAPAVAITGLVPLTTYHARCTVTNAQGSVTSADGTFTTAGIPVVTTAAATNVGDLSATFVGATNPNGLDSIVSVSFEFGTTTNYGMSINATPGIIVPVTQTSFTGRVTNLLPGTTYHYRAKANYYSVLTTFYGPDVTFTTGPAATPPTVESPFVFNGAMTASSAAVETFEVFSGSSPANVSWEYGTTTDYGGTVTGWPVQVATNTSTEATGSFQHLTPSTTYHYRCKVVNSEGTAYSPDAVFTTLPAPTLAASAATGITDHSAALHGTANANGGYYRPFFYVYPPTGDTLIVYPSEPYFSGSSTVPLNGSVSGLLPNTTYTYRVVALNYSPDYFFGQEQSFTTGPANTPPSVVTGSATNAATTAATLQASTVSAGSSPATVVFEYGATAAYGSQFTYATVIPTSTSAVPTCQITGLTPNTTYHFRVKATNNEGAAVGDDATFTTLAVPTVTTDPVSNLGGSTTTLNGTYNKQGGTYTISFDYGITTDYGSTANPGGFVIIGGGGGVVTIGGGGGILIGGGGIIIGGTPDFTTHTTSATASGLLPQITYHYRLKLTDNYGNSYYGADATFTTVSPVEAWRMAKFATPNNAGDAADTANPSGDGIPNLMKYALGMEPAVPGTVPKPQLKDYSGAQYLSLTFQRDPNKSDIIYIVEAADSPAGPWTTLASSGSGLGCTGPGLVSETQLGIIFNGTVSPVTVEVRDTQSLQDSPHRFMRLRVTR